MRIAIDCRWVSKDTGGIRRYTLNLIQSLSKIDSSNSYHLISDTLETEKVLRNRLTKPEDKIFLKVPYGPFSFKNHIFLPILLNKNKIDVFYSPNFMAPLRACKYKVIITIHDLIPYLHPEWCHRSIKSKFILIFKTLMFLSVKKANQITTDSNFSKEDIVRSFSCSKDKVTVIYCGMENRFYPVQDKKIIEDIKNKYRLKKNNILYVGRQDPSKNIVGLIKAFDMLKHNSKMDCKLIIVGKKDERYPEPYQLVEELNMKDDVIFTGNVDDKELLALYNASDLFVFPSLYEGFGLPPLEAMACGLPVIVSNVSSLPEVVGDAAQLVNPAHIGEIAENMKILLTNQDLRNELKERGIRQAKKYNWEATATKLLSLFEKTIQTKN